MYTRSVVNTCHIHWWIGIKRFKIAKVTFKVTQGHELLVLLV